MWFFGRNPLKEALKAHKDIELIYIAEGTKLPIELHTLLSESKATVKRVQRSVIERLIGHRRHGGVAFRMSSITLIDPEEVLSKTVRTKGYSLFLDRVQDPQNVGNIIRSAYLFGANGVLMSAHKTSSLSNIVVNASAGTALLLPIARVSNPLTTLLRFKNMGGFILALDVSGKDLRKISFPFPCIIVLGSEGKGIRHSILKHSDLILSIPIRGVINSLNVTSAGAIALFKAFTDKENE